MRPLNHLLTVLSLAILMLSCGTIKSQNKMNIEENKGENYAVIMLNITNVEGYNKYRKKTKKLLLKAGGHIEREFDVMGQKGNIPNFETPNRVIVIHWDSPNGQLSLMNNPKYIKASELLKLSATNIRVVKGTSEMFQSSNSDEQGRMYLIKMSYYKNNTHGRVDMLNEIGPKLAPYGFYTERMIMVNESVGFEKPNEFTIHFHDFAYQNEELQKDSSIKSLIGEYNQKYLTQFVYLPLKLKN
ncbi:MAG: DUF1330 domain-containing protein [Flavobacteriales bacterium]|nr:DUF1330 domain-containing protein [Flavobacteriales bacterium]